ncbi:MAG TPA: MFS transporter [Thermaerobacter sp.]
MAAETRLLTAVACATLLNPLNSSMIAVALPQIAADFGVSFPRLTWLIATYYLASAIIQPVAGKISDLFGRRRVFFGGLALVALASALAPRAPTLGALIAFRILQAVGSSSLYPAGMSVIRERFTHQQGQALGVLAVFASTSAALGPSLGGLLVQWGGWPAIFSVNFVPIAISLALGLGSFPADRPQDEPAPESGRRGPAPVPRAVRPWLAALERLDPAGVFWFSATVLAGLYGLLSLEQPRPAWWALPAALGLAALFTRHELARAGNGREPFVDLRVFRRDPARTRIYLAWISSNVAFYSIFFGMPAYFQEVRHLDAGRTGLMMLSVAGVGSVASPLIGRWVDRYGHRPVLLAGAASLLAGAAALAAAGPGAPVGLLFAPLAVLGTSNGINNLALQAALYRFVPREETGAASGLYMTCRYIGTILASSLLGLLFNGSAGPAVLRELALALLVPGVLVWVLVRGIPQRGVEENGVLAARP